MSFQEPLTRRIVEFLRNIGVDVRRVELCGPTLLPGVDIRAGALLVDEMRLLHPGDLLHEAGHIAVSEPNARAAETPNFSDAGEEMAAIAWSFAAARAIGVSTDVVFHDGGYRGWGPSLVENFEAERYFGHPLLKCWGMTLDPREAAARGVRLFPHMLRWLR